MTEANTESRTLRVAFSLAEVSRSTGLSQGYLRNEVRAKRLPIKKFGRRVVVLSSDLQRYLAEGSPSKKVDFARPPKEGDDNAQSGKR